MKIFIFSPLNCLNLTFCQNKLGFITSQKFNFFLHRVPILKQKFSCENALFQNPIFDKIDKKFRCKSIVHLIAMLSDYNEVVVNSENSG